MHSAQTLFALYWPASQDWRASLDTAVEKFREAGCPENEIRGALQAHSMKDELDLGPDPADKPAAEVRLLHTNTLMIWNTRP